MGALTKGNLLDNFEINKEKFETAVSLGKSHHQIRTLFCLGLLIWNGEDIYGLDVGEYLEKNCKHIEGLLDKWCLENYRLPYNTVYSLLQEQAIANFEDLMVGLGIRGHVSALGIANEIIRKKENTGVVTVNFVNALPPESEAEKEDD